MESSEDDAGTATNASRRASAREKDVGLAEDVNATSSFQQEPSEARSSCETPAMSEDNFDGDSVPSPSAQDVNTSTEAILDMIDEIVDGPGAPKRIPLASESGDERFDELELTSEHSGIIQESVRNDHDNNSSLHVVASSADSVESEPFDQLGSNSQIEPITVSDLSTNIVNTDSFESLPQNPDSVNQITLNPDTLPKTSSVSVEDGPAVSLKSENTIPETLSVPTSDEPVVFTNSVDSVPESSSVPQIDEPNVCPSVDILPESSSVTVEEKPGVSIETVHTLPESSSESTADEPVVSTKCEDSLPECPESSSSHKKDESLVSTKSVEPLPESSPVHVEPETDESTKSVHLSPESSLVPMVDENPVSTKNVDIESEHSSCNQVEDETGVPTKSEHPLPESSSVLEEEPPAVSMKTEDNDLSNVVPEILAGGPVPNIPSSIEEQTVKNISEVSECDTQERTIKCVTSSDNRDKVTVESAESTSSDTSVSEGKTVHVEQQVRSPLRRRLVRPAPSDRRPDSTVSSTVDSQIATLSTAEQTSSENITKDVSSSSDAVPSTHGNVKPDEIRNVSEINFCKAETSVSPPKKIKLIRQKVTSNRDTSVSQSAILSERDQCQSTSSDNRSLPLPEPQSESSSTVSNSRDNDVTTNEISLPVSNCELEKLSPEEAGVSAEHSQPSIDQSQLSKKEADKHEGEDVAVFIQEKPYLPNSSGSVADVSTEQSTQVIPCMPNSPEPVADVSKSTSIVQELGSLPQPISVEANTNVKVNDLVQDSLINAVQDEHKGKSVTCETDCNEVLPIQLSTTPSPSLSTSNNSENENSSNEEQGDQKKVPPIKLNLSVSSLPESKLETEQSSISKSNVVNEEIEVTKQVPKLTIKLKQPDETKSPVPKLTIKPIRPPPASEPGPTNENVEQVPSVTKLNIKPILKPPESEKPVKSQHGVDETKLNASEQLPCITKLTIKPIPKPPEKINDIHRKSSSSEISESEYSENDESASTSDQASTSDHGSTEAIPKVTIKMGKPGTESAGKFYTEQNVPKLTIKGFQQDDKDEQEHKLKLVISQSEEKQSEKIPKLTIKTVGKTESQPLSPKLTIKPLKPPDALANKEPEIPKLKISTESFSSSSESSHVPKITIKPVTRSSAMCDSPEHIPVVTKLNIKPILKPTESAEPSEGYDDKVPVVSKLNIKPVIKPKDNDVGSSVDEVPKITKLNIKPIKNPEENSSEEKDCDELNADIDENSIPVVTKINIKPIIKHEEEETLKDSENQSSETGNSSDDNGDHIPVVTKLNIKPIIKPDDLEESSKTVSSSEQSIPVITKLNIKPLVKPGETVSPASPKKEHKVDGHSSVIPVVTKLNIKPIVKPEELEPSKSKDEAGDKGVKKPPLVMKINMKDFNNESLHNEHICNNVTENSSAPPKSVKLTSELDPETLADNKKQKRSSESINDVHESIDQTSTEKPKQNCIPEVREKKDESDDRSNKKTNLSTNEKLTTQPITAQSDSLVTASSLQDIKTEKVHKSKEVNEHHTSYEHKNINIRNTDSTTESKMVQQPVGRPKSSMQNCTLLKKLLETTTNDSLEKNLEVSTVMNCTVDKNDSTNKRITLNENLLGSNNSDKINLELDKSSKRSSTPDKVNDSNKSLDSGKLHSMQELREQTNENVTKPLEITISDKISNQNSGQDSPRIILKINKTDHGPSAKIITEEVKKPDVQHNYIENTQEIINDKQSPKKQTSNRKKQVTDTPINLSTGKRLRSSRIVETVEKTPVAKRNVGKRPPSTETSPTQNKESDLSMLQTKRLKLGQLLSNKTLGVTGVSKPSPPSPTTDIKQEAKTVNHSLLNNENCSKNGNSKLHNILSNLHAKKMQSLPYNNTNCSDISQSVATDIELNPSQQSSSDTVEIVENSHPDTHIQEMIINENSDFRDFSSAPEEVSQDPLEVGNSKPSEEPPEIIDIPKPAELTPQPKKRGRPRKLPVSEGAKPVVALPVPALEERPQRSLRLMRDRPAILQKPRGRGRGRGGRRAEGPPPTELETIVVIEPADEAEEKAASGEIDPTSSRIKLPRMTEALDKMPSVCTTPLSSRRRNSSGNFSAGETPELKVVLDKVDEFGKSPEPGGSARGRGGRGSRGGRGRTPRGRGRGRGGGRGAMYMKETLGIYGRVCGPATTTVQLFEEETCMMDDNATPAKPSHLLDEDSQSSVKSSTNESSKFKKSKFADLFDSNKVWTAADVKEYTWPPPEKPDVEHKVMMIQEQVAMFLGVKSFKRRYVELKRRTITGEEREYVLSKGLVTEALCDLGITAVDASEVLDIMLSDYPHKYEEFRSYQRQRQLTETVEEPEPDVKTEEKDKVEMKPEKPVESKPEVPKIDPEKTRQDMAAAAIASASEWNARANASRRGACADLQSLSVLRPRAPQPPPARPHVRPPAGFYPHALLPGQYQHAYRAYTPDQLRYFPLNTVLAAPPAPASEDWSSESEPDWGSRCSSSEDSDVPTHHSAKRKKLTKTKRSSQTEVASSSKEEPRVTEEVDLCRVCKMRLEANRRYTHERFLVCANCNAKLHPSCLELSADTIRKCREYPWQCAECKTCCSCRQPADDDKMLFCDLCDRGFHIYCVGLDTVPSGRWHCVECAICKSCGARSPGGLSVSASVSGSPPAQADWHHQTRRGPGGHKVYSHSLCTPCARAYRIGRYCPLCERSFIGPKGTMQLVICKLCDRQLHQECVRQTVSNLNVLDYTCAECRRGGITSRAAAVRLAPRTIATLFMAKRRFNKYAHRQYLASRARDAADTSCDEPAPHAVDVEPVLDASDASDGGGDASDPLDPAPDPN